METNGLSSTIHHFDQAVFAPIHLNDVDIFKINCRTHTLSELCSSSLLMFVCT